MTVHLLKMAVGIDSIAHLSERQAERRAEAGGELVHLTRNMPRRASAVLDGGSIYWVIRRMVRVRQRIVGLDRRPNRHGEPRCALILDPELVPVAPVPQRPLQGWRYLEPEDAPPDRDEAAISGDSLPPEMAEELRALGLL